MSELEATIQKTLGLSEYEAKIYTATLQLGNASVSELSRATQISRTAVYPPIKSLTARGFISQVTVGKRVQYQALSPQQLLALHEERGMSLKNAIERFAPSIIQSGSDELMLRYFPGKAGITSAASIFLNETKGRLWKTVEHPEHMLFAVGSKEFDEYIQRRVEKKIRSKTIIPTRLHTEWVAQHLADDAADLRETLVVSSDMYPIEATIAISDDTLFAAAAKNKPFAFLARSKPLVQTIESLFDMTWDRYRS